MIAAAPVPPVLDNDPVLFGPGDPPVSETDEHHSLTNPNQGPPDAPDDLEVDDPTGVEDDLDSDVDETTGVEDDLNSAVDNDTDDELVEDDDSLEDIHPTTESHKFQQAVSDGISRALEGNGQWPRRRHTKKVKDPAFEYINLSSKIWSHGWSSPC